MGRGRQTAGFPGQERGNGLSDALQRYIVRAGEEHRRISIPEVEKQVPSLYTFQDEKFAFQAFFNHL